MRMTNAFWIQVWSCASRGPREDPATVALLNYVLPDFFLDVCVVAAS